MKFYTKGNRHVFFSNHHYVNIDRFGGQNNIVFWYDQHDGVIFDLKFDIFLNDRIVNHLHNDPTSKILFFYPDEYYSILDLENWAKTLLDKKIDPRQVYIVCVDDNWVRWTLQNLKKLGLENINIQSYNILMSRVDITSISKNAGIIDNKGKRFSIFSRNYNTWRLHFFVKLLQSGILDNSYYTFNNINPYGNIRTFDKESIKKDVLDLKLDLNTKTLEWIENIPYTTRNHIFEKFPDQIYKMIFSSGINIIVESHFDPFATANGHRQLYDARDFSPAFPTEKIYKGIGCGKPFIVFSTPYFLKEFKQLGYKTFHPFINESYDIIYNDNERLDAIVREIDRISKLNDSDYNDLIKKCNDIAQYNKLHMIELKKQIEFNSNFRWLNAYASVNPFDYSMHQGSV